MPTYTALMHMHRAVKIDLTEYVISTWEFAISVQIACLLNRIVKI